MGGKAEQRGTTVTCNCFCRLSLLTDLSLCRPELSLFTSFLNVLSTPTLTHRAGQGEAVGWELPGLTRLPGQKSLLQF